MLVTELCLQCDVLTNKLLLLGNDEDNENILSVIHKIHYTTFRLCIDVDKIFSKIFLIQFASSFILISTGLFMASKGDTAYLFVFVCGAMQLGIYCAFGQILKNKFDSLVFLFYNNQFYNLSMKDKKALIIMMSFAQASPTLKAGGYIDLSLETYMEILKLAYSYLAIMKNMQPEE